MLIDDIFDSKNNKRPCLDLHQNPNAPMAGLFEFMQDAPVFNLRGLQDAFDQQVATKGFDFIEHAFCVRPPYARIWCEYLIRPEDGLDKPLRIGALVEAWEQGPQHIPRETMIDALRNHEARTRGYLQVMPTAEPVHVASSVMVAVSTVIEAVDMYMAYPRYGMTVCEATGKPITVPFTQEFPLTLPAGLNHKAARDLLEASRRQVMNQINLIWFAMSLLSCKNVEAEKHAHDAKLQHARQRRDKQPLRDFYTLNVRLPKSAQARTGGQATGELRPFHTVMGHLADYREGAGLFGKHKGVFWIPAHVRGNKDAGIINKSYALKGKQ